jgi:protein phosphatase
MAPAEISQYAVSVLGNVRENQEDSYLSWSADADGLAAVLAVADGMGGHQAGEVASGTAIATLEAGLCRTAGEWRPEGVNEVAERLKAVVGAANRAVLELDAADGAPRPGTTLTAAAIWRDRLVVGHVGDSRCYLVRAGRASQLTEDHTMVAEQVRLGNMTAEAARRSPYRNSLVRCLGSEPQVAVDTVATAIEPGDVVLICSDGLTEYVEALEIGIVLASRELPAALDLLRDLALERGGHDNITVVAAQCGARELLPEQPLPPYRSGDTQTLELPVLDDGFEPPLPAPTVSRAVTTALVTASAVILVIGAVTAVRQHLAATAPPAMVAPAQPPPGAPALVESPTTAVVLMLSAQGSALVLDAPARGLTVTPLGNYHVKLDPEGLRWQISGLKRTDQDWQVRRDRQPNGEQSGTIGAEPQPVTLAPGRWVLELRAKSAKVKWTAVADLIVAGRP